MLDLHSLRFKPFTSEPFPHVVIDNFFDLHIANQLAAEHMALDDPRWLRYNSDTQVKLACNNWNAFPETTYSVFYELLSSRIWVVLEDRLQRKIYPDYGLHGGGWHAHGSGGYLKPHLDYSIHPKLGLQRLLNLIVYLTPGMTEPNGGHLGLYEHNAEDDAPGKLAVEIVPKFNRAILFDTTQNSWHGMSRPLVLPEGAARRSIAVYYLTEPEGGDPTRTRAHFHVK